MLNLFLFAWIPLLSFSGEFSKGSNFNFRNLEGEIEIQCPGQQTSTYCREQFLEPWPYDFFKGPQIPEANRIIFEVKTNLSQEIRTTEAVYFGLLGRSEEINLGISSLFQRPLLKIGTNRIQFKLLDRTKKILFEGSFLVTVGRSAPLTCGLQKVKSQNSEDCQLTYSVCQQYFNDLNYCR